MTDSTLKKIDKYAFSLKDVLGKGSFGIYLILDIYYLR